MQVQFGENSYSKKPAGPSKKLPRFVRWAMKLPFVKTEAVANYTLLAIAAIAFGLSIIFFTSVFDQPDIESDPLIEEGLEEEFIQ